MFDQSEIIWRYLSGMDPGARREFELAGRGGGLLAGTLARGARPGRDASWPRGRWHPERDPAGVASSVFSLADSGRRQEAFTLAQRELKGRLQPALTQMNREVYRRARESSVRGAYARLEEILAGEGRTLLVIIALTLAVGTARLLAHLPRPHPADPRAHRGDGGGGLGQARSSGHADLPGRDRRAGRAPSARMTEQPAPATWPSWSAPRRSWCSRRSSPRSARWRPRWPTGSGTRWRACARRPSWCGATPTRPPPASTSTPSSRRWTGSTAGSATC